MKTLVLNIPDTVSFDEKEALMIISSGLYDKGKLTLGQAAELVGLSKGHSWRSSATTEHLFLITHLRTLTETLRM